MDDTCNSIAIECCPPSPEIALMYPMPGCIGHNGVESSLDDQPMDTSCDDVTSFRDRREPPIDVRLHVCQPLKASISMVDLIMSNANSRVKLGIQSVPE